MTRDIGPLPVTSRDIGPTDNQDNGGGGYTPSLDDSGFTAIPEPVVGRKVYVDAVSGSDSNDGLSEGAAKATVSAGFALLRDGYDDQLLLKRGQTHSSGVTTDLSGYSESAPIIYGTYGTGARPIVSGFGMTGGGGRSGPVNNWQLHGWHVSQSSPGNAISLLLGGSNGLIEDCYCDDTCAEGISIINTDGPWSNITIRRTVIHNCHDTSSSGITEGFFAAGVDGLTIDECIFDYNGWNAAAAGPGDLRNIYKHNMYINETCTNVTVKKTWSSRGASHGLQQRPGGVCEDNVLYKNAINLLVGNTESGVETVVQRNGSFDTDDIDGSNLRGWAMEVSANNGEASNVVAYNICARTTGTGPKLPFGATSTTGSAPLTLKKNIFYKLGTALRIYGTVVDARLDSNDIYVASGLVVDQDASGDVTSSSNNRYWTSEADGSRFDLAGSTVTDAAWKSDVSDSGSTFTDLSAAYTDPEKDMDDFAVSIGLADADALLARLITQRKGNWDTKIEAAAINAYFRANFDMIPAPSSFTATRDGVDVDLESTSYAPESDSFVFQRSPNGVDTWTQIATPTSPSATDTNPGTGTWYYRCASVVDSVTGDWSDVASVTLSDGGASNPSGNGTWAFWW